MLDILIIFVRKLNFVKLRRNRLYIFETTLRYTVSTVGEMHETILSITGGDLTPCSMKDEAFCVNSLQLSVINNCHKELHLRCCRTKVIPYFDLLLFQMASSKC